MPIVYLQPANPAAGASVSFVVSVSGIIRAVKYTFIADANVATRRTYIRVLDAAGAAILGYGGASSRQFTASQTDTVVHAVGGYTDANGALLLNQMAEVPINSGQRISIASLNLQIGDTFTDIGVWVDVK